MKTMYTSVAQVAQQLADFWWIFLRKTL